MSTPGGIDKVLTALSYALTLVAPQVARVSSALGGGRRRQRLLPSTFPPPSPSGLPARLRALSALISDVRTFMRLWGLFSIWEWGVTTLRMPRGTDVVARRIVLAQVGVNAFFQACENAAYLSRHAVVALPGGKATERRLWAWSSRAWAAHIALEFWRLERERRIRNERRRRGRAPVQARQLELSEEEAWTRGWVVNAANAPLSVCFIPPVYEAVYEGRVDAGSKSGRWEK